MNLFWKTYFCLYLIFVFAGYTVGLSYLDFSKVQWDVVDLLRTGVLFVGLVGLYGFVFSKPFGWPVFWKVVCVLFIGADLAHDAYMSFSDWKIVPDEYKTLGFNALMIGAAMLGYLIVVPHWIVLYRYGFKCRDVWAQTG